MKEIKITKSERMGFDSFRTETIYFVFDEYEGRFIKTFMPYGVEYEVGYTTAYANWNTASRSATTLFNTNEGLINYTEFLQAFKEKFGIEIPTV